jgi:hypothetical protein
MIKKTSLSALAAALVCSLLSFNANAEFAADGTGCAINGASDINVALDGSSFVDHGNVMVGTIIERTIRLDYDITKDFDPNCEVKGLGIAISNYTTGTEGPVKVLDVNFVDGAQIVPMSDMVGSLGLIMRLEVIDPDMYNLAQRFTYKSNMTLSVKPL